jgi:ribulose-phosphate 3-epimerase
VKAGISINPDMPVERVLPYLGHFDYLLVMSVFPGFGGQAFIPSALGKIATARAYIDDNKLPTLIEVDGGVDGSNAAELAHHGADILVMGTAFFRQADRKLFVETVMQRVQQRHE